MKEKKLRGLFSLQQRWSEYVMLQNEDRRNGNKKMEKKAFARIWFLKKQTRSLSQEHLPKGLVLQERCLWSRKCSLACNKKCSNPFRTETRGAIATYCKSAQLRLEAVPVCTLRIKPLKSVPGDFILSLHWGFWWGEYKGIGNCPFSRWEISQYFCRGGGTCTISAGNQFYSVSSFSTWYLCSVVQN